MSAGPICCAVSFFACCRERSRPASRNKTIGAEGSSGFSTISRRRIRRRIAGMAETAMQPAANTLPDVAEMCDADLLAGEKKALGFYLSSHPLSRHAGLLQALATPPRGPVAVARREDGSRAGGNDHQRQGNAT